MKTYAKATLATIIAFAASVHSPAEDIGAWMAALEAACSYIPSDYSMGDDEETIPTPESVQSEYNLSAQSVLEGLKAIAQKYGADETNMYNRCARLTAVGAIGRYGTTNEIGFLRATLLDPGDYAQQSALGASIRLLARSESLIPFMQGVSTNRTAFSWGLRAWGECRLLDMCDEKSTSHYINDASVRARIAAYFTERAKEEVEQSLFIDNCACDLNPWYRHSQLRRDNLARARSREENLTETAAAAYDARQSDAAAEGD